MLVSAGHEALDIPHPEQAVPAQGVGTCHFGAESRCRPLLPRTVARWPRSRRTGGLHDVHVRRIVTVMLAPSPYPRPHSGLHPEVPFRGSFFRGISRVVRAPADSREVGRGFDSLASTILVVAQPTSPWPVQPRGLEQPWFGVRVGQLVAFRRTSRGWWSVRPLPSRSPARRRRLQEASSRSLRL